MASFDRAVAPLLESEGGLSDRPADRGGLTKHGISQRSYPDLDIATVTTAQAREIYHRDFWHPLYDQLQSQRMADELLESAVNHGPGMAHRLLQKALRRAGQSVTVDGVFGPQTLAAANAVPEPTLWVLFTAERIVRYVLIAEADPVQKAHVFGWIVRALA